MLGFSRALARAGIRNTENGRTRLFRISDDAFTELTSPAERRGSVRTINSIVARGVKKNVFPPDYRPHRFDRFCFCEIISIDKH
jgi:hypothetical protein